MPHTSRIRCAVRAWAPVGAALTASVGLAASAQAASGASVCRSIARDGTPAGVALQRYPSAASPWTGDANPGPLVLIRRARTRVGVLCDTAGRSWRTPIVLRQGEHLGTLSLADPWIAWTVHRDDRRATVRTARLNRTRATGRTTIRGIVRSLAVTVDGNAAVAAGTAPTRRVVLLRRNGHATALRLASRVPRAAISKLGVGRWGTHGLALRDQSTGPTRDQAFPFDPRRSDLQARCRPSAATVVTASTSALSVQLANSASWSTPDANPTEKHLAICDPADRLLRASFLAVADDDFLQTDGPEVFSRDRATIVVAGPVVLVRETQSTGTSGTGTDTRDVRSGFVVRPTGDVEALRPALVTGTPAAAAYVDDGRLWLSDADGLRPVATARALTERNTALVLQSASLLVRTPGFDQRIPFRPLPADDTATLSIEPARPTDAWIPADDLCGSSYSGGTYGCDKAPGSPPQLADPSSPPPPGE